MYFSCKVLFVSFFPINNDTKREDQKHLEKVYDYKFLETYYLKAKDVLKSQSAVKPVNLMFTQFVL